MSKSNHEEGFPSKRSSHEVSGVKSVGSSPKYSWFGVPMLAGDSFHMISRTLLMLIILQVWGATAVFAGLEFVDGNERAKVYVDPETVTRSGEWVSVWVMDDLKITQTRGFRTYLSSRAQEQHDCIKGHFRLLALEYFSGNMGSGEALYKTSGESDWAPIPQGTLAQSVWKFVCGSRIP